MAGNNMKRVKDLGIDFIEGFGRLKGKNEIEIDLNGTKKTITAANIVLNMVILFFMFFSCKIMFLSFVNI